jgi:NTE family protein
MKIASWLCVFLCASFVCGGAPRHRPRVALVLEGGGALGFAHIGVIQYLEEKHIPVDLVVGTSMGGLVGGLYSIGNSPAQIQDLVNQIDWDAVLSGRTPFQDLNFRRKEDRISFPNRLEFGLKGRKFNMPAGLNSGHQTGLVIDRATLAYSDDLNFDDFPIPFRCVATDIVAGREKIFDRGSIAHALRATMSIPGVFAPTVVDGRAYSDGGAVNNLPVDVAKSLKADIVIAVYLDTGPVDTAAYDSLLSVAARNVSLMISANELKNMQEADILLSVDLRDFTSADFKAGPKIVPKGLEAARRKERLLANLAVNDDEWRDYIATRDRKVERALPPPQFVTVSGTYRDYDEALKESLTQFINKPVNPAAIEETLTRFTGSGLMSSAGYTMLYQGGKPGLGAYAYEKTYGPPFLNLGITIDGSEPDNVLFGLAARLTFMNLGGYRAEWRSDAFFGSIYGVQSEYFRPLTHQGKFFVAPHAYAVNSPFDEYQGRDRIGQYRTEREGFGADLGYSINTRSEIRAGEDMLWFKVKRRITSDPFANFSSGEAVSTLRYRYYGADNAVLPRSGLTLESSLSWYHLNEGLSDFPRLEVRTSYFQPVNPVSSVFVTASGGSTFHTPWLNTELQAFSLGGSFRLGAYGQNQLLGNQYFLGQTGYERKLLSFSPLVGEGLYGLVFFEAGKAYGLSTNAPHLPLDGSVAVVARTSLGPLFMGGSLGNGGNRKWWFGLGRVF